MLTPETLQEVGMKIVIIKLGTSCVWHEQWPERTIDGCVELMASGYRVIIVSSGAIMGGIHHLKERAHLNEREARFTYPKPALAGLGTLPLLERWKNAMTPHGLSPIPLWVTHRNMTDGDERRSIQEFIRAVLCNRHGIIVANENDSVSHDEINRWDRGLGENDKLTEALVRLVKKIQGVEVTGAYFGTKIGGYFNPPPSSPESVLVRTLRWSDVSPEQLLYFHNPALSPDKVIPNTMMPKLCAAVACYRHGVTHVGIGLPERVADFMLRHDTFVGTRIVP